MRKSFLAVCLPAALLVGAGVATLGQGHAPFTWPAPAATAAAEPGPSDGIVLPILDSTWWKLKVKAKGYTVNGETGEIQSATFKTTAYMFLEAITEAGPSDGGGDGFPLYTYVVFTEIGEDVWSDTYGDTIFVDGLDENGHEALVVGTFMGFITSKGTGVASFYTGKLKIKVDDQGILKSASLKSLAGQVSDSAIDGENFYGSMTISGKTVDVEDLPFELL